METYEKKYEDAQKWIESIYTELSHERQMEAEAFFPELKESVDEKNIKNLIDELKCSLRGANCQNESCNGGQEKRIALLEWAIAWLEKQGVPKTIKSIFEVWKDMRCEVYAQASGNRHEPNCSDNTTKLFSLNDIDELIEKLGEQKPTDKVRPKFKVGDWIVYEEKCYKVNYNGCGYELIDQNGLKGSLVYGVVDNNAHLWTINDAKDGDILYSLDSKQPFIFKHRKPHEQAAVYCGINIYGKFFVENTNDCIITADKYIPADKFQRNLLFQKMKESGYEWDAEKKELKKIEQNLTWSEEEKDLMYDTLSNLTELKDRYGEGYGNVGKCIGWIKSLKEKLKETKGGEI